MVGSAFMGISHELFADNSVCRSDSLGGGFSGVKGCGVRVAVLAAPYRPRPFRTFLGDSAEPRRRDAVTIHRRKAPQDGRLSNRTRTAVEFDRLPLRDPR